MDTQGPLYIQKETPASAACFASPSRNPSSSRDLLWLWILVPPQLVSPWVACRLAADLSCCQASWTNPSLLFPFGCLGSDTLSPAQKAAYPHNLNLDLGQGHTPTPLYCSFLPSPFLVLIDSDSFSPIYFVSFSLPFLSLSLDNVARQGHDLPCSSVDQGCSTLTRLASGLGRSSLWESVLGIMSVLQNLCLHALDADSTSPPPTVTIHPGCL